MIAALGAGFGNAAQIVLDGSPLATISATDTSVVAVVPDGAATSGVHTFQVSNSGTLSNSVYMPTAVASPAIYSVDGSGTGQGCILSDSGGLHRRLLLQRNRGSGGAGEWLAGNVLQVSVYVPDPAVLAQNNPDLKKFPFSATDGYPTGDGTAGILAFQSDRDSDQSQVDADSGKRDATPHPR